MRPSEHYNKRCNVLFMKDKTLQIEQSDLMFAEQANIVNAYAFRMIWFVPAPIQIVLFLTI